MSQDKELAEFLKSKAKWPGSSNDTFRQTCGGKHANMQIDIANSDERSTFCQLMSLSTIWQSALTGKVDEDRRKNFEILSTGKRVDCLTQVFPKTDLKFAFMTTSCLIDFNKLIESIPKEFGRFYVFQRNPIESLNEEFPVYQCYFTDCQFKTVESLQNILKQIETQSGCKMDRRIYTNCIQFPGCFITNSPTLDVNEKSFFKWVKIDDLNFDPPTPEDLILTHFHSDTSHTLSNLTNSLTSPTSSSSDILGNLGNLGPSRKRQKSDHFANAIVSFDAVDTPEIKFVDAWINYLICCPSSDDLFLWPGCLISKVELFENFRKQRPMLQFDEDIVTNHLLVKWGFVFTKTIRSLKSDQKQEFWDTYFLIPTRTQLSQRLENFVLDYKRNLNSFINRINRRDLTLDYSTINQNETIQCVFHNFEQEISKLLKEYDCFVGCIAWLNDVSIISQMKGKSLGMVVTKDPKNWVDDNLRDHLNKMTMINYPVTSGIHPGTRFDETKDPTEMAGMLRCVGDRSQSEDFILMHNKFLVFGNKIENATRTNLGNSDAFFVFEPKCVWTGSRNFTFAAKRHKENAVIIHDEKIARSYHMEWANLYLNSEPINTEHLVFSPFDYFVV